ncbi:MAG: RHS repeat-associated core domain-containing protein [Phycisphaeraceae bacterium]|nr:RHS repeat-associated core domain-containing protein [Phycisphaeraceae bacterium]
MINGEGKSIGDSGYHADMDLDRDGSILPYGVSEDITRVAAFGTRAALPKGWISGPRDEDGPDNEVGYAGYRFNCEEQIYCVRFRHYSPRLGRWIERDPAGYVDGGNLYQYGSSDPIMFVDPSGLASGRPDMACTMIQWSGSGACRTPKMMPILQDLGASELCSDARCSRVADYIATLADDVASQEEAAANQVASCKTGLSSLAYTDRDCIERRRMSIQFVLAQLEAQWHDNECSGRFSNDAFGPVLDSRPIRSTEDIVSMWGVRRENPGLSSTLDEVLLFTLFCRVPAVFRVESASNCSTRSGGLISPDVYFRQLSPSQARTALIKKCGPPRSIREGAETFYNPVTKRSYNVHTDPLHGPPHVDIRRRGPSLDRKCILYD